MNDVAGRTQLMDTGRTSHNTEVPGDRFLGTLADSLPFGLCIVEAGRLSYFNRQFQAYAGCIGEELVGIGVMGLVHPDDRERVSRMSAAAAKGERSEPYQYRLLGKNGDVRWVTETAVPVQNDGGTAILHCLMDVTGLKLSEEESRESESRLRALTQRMLEIQEDERARFARDLHDEMGQDIVFLKMAAASLAEQLRDTPGLWERASELAEVAERLKTTSRRIAANVGPGILDSLGLVKAIEWYAEEFERRTRLSCPVDAPVGEISPGKATAIAAYRILQEALTNVWKHSGASQAQVRVRVEGNTIVLEVSDNGVGISAQQFSGKPSLGLLGMNERARLAGGVLRVSSPSGRGTRVTALLPMDS